jgi:hypothetical protein
VRFSPSSCRLRHDPACSIGSPCRPWSSYLDPNHSHGSRTLRETWRCIILRAPGATGLTALPVLQAERLHQPDRVVHTREKRRQRLARRATRILRLLRRRRCANLARGRTAVVDHLHGARARDGVERRGRAIPGQGLGLDQLFTKLILCRTPWASQCMHRIALRVMRSNR